MEDKKLKITPVGASCLSGLLCDFMKISEIIEKLEVVKYHIGDVECYIEVMLDDVLALEQVGEIAYEKREGLGESVVFLI